MLLITSLMNNGKDEDIQNQRSAIQTWKNLGFRVLSANVKEEIEALKDCFAKVEFAELPRSGKEQYGKPIPYIFDMLKILEQCASEGEICGIINSDIYLRNIGANDLEQLLEGGEEKIVCFHRYDISSKEELDGEYYFSGIDAFFMKKETLRIFEDAGYALSKPEWDHWVVYSAIMNDIKVLEVKDAVAFHVKHVQRWTPGESNALGNSSRKPCRGEEYYDLTNRVLACVENRVLLGTDVSEDELEIESANQNLYFEKDIMMLAAKEMKRHNASALTFPLGVGYYRGTDFKRICALHGNIAENDLCIHKRGEEGAKVIRAGEIAAYVDFMQTEAARSLKRFYVYSAGRAGRLMLDCLQWNGIEPLGFVDKDEMLQGTSYKKVPIFGLDVLARGEEYDQILLVSNLYVEEIYRELSSLVDKEKIIII